MRRAERGKMKTYLYSSHLGGYYFSDHKKTLKECYCDGCCDYDNFVCEINDNTTVFELLNTFKQENEVEVSINVIL